MVRFLILNILFLMQILTALVRILLIVYSIFLKIIFNKNFQYD